MWVPFLFWIFTGSWHLTQEEDEGVNALNLLLGCFACHEDNVDIQNIDINKWGDNQTVWFIKTLQNIMKILLIGVGSLKPDVRVNNKAFMVFFYFKKHKKEHIFQ
jgi:hypothetical protein